MSTESNTEGAPPSQDNLSDDPTQTANLSSRAISAIEAKRCCDRNVTTIERELLGLYGQLLGEALQADLNADPSAVLAFIPAGRPTILPKPVFRVPPQVKLLPARVVPVTGAIIGGAVLIRAIAAQTAALETLTAVGVLLNKYFDDARENGSCEQCVRQKMWGQDKPQKKELSLIRRRVL